VFPDELGKREVEGRTKSQVPNSKFQGGAFGKLELGKIKALRSMLLSHANDGFF